LPIAIEDLPAVNATLNALAAVMLVVGWALIKSGRERAHRNWMLSAFGVSIAFLTCYLVYHYHHLSMPFQGPDALRPWYYVLLITHVVLAACVPVLASITIYLGLADRRVRHRQFARWTFPIWLYVSVTGVIIYLVLYHVYPPSSPVVIIEQVSPVGQSVSLQMEGCVT
jgi:uncharacterized membrane protein YozB (DUF420 family)